MTVTVQPTLICQGHVDRHEGIVMIRNMRYEEASGRQSAEFSEQYLLDRLMAAGIACLDDWRALSPRARRNIFGITTGMARAIDQMVKARGSDGAG